MWVGVLVDQLVVGHARPRCQPGGCRLRAGGLDAAEQEAITSWPHGVYVVVLSRLFAGLCSCWVHHVATTVCA